jgi:hypothetical protein
VTCKELVGKAWSAVLYAEDRRREPGKLCRDDFYFAEMYCCLIGLFLQLEAEGDPEVDDADKDVNIIGDDVQTETEATGRHTEAEMPAMEVPTTGIPDEAKIPYRPEV